MPNPDTDPERPRYAAVCASPTAASARVVDGDRGLVLAELPRADADRYAHELNLAHRASSLLARLADLAADADADTRELDDALDAFDRWHDTLRARGDDEAAGS
jgi:hypothetical protein